MRGTLSRAMRAESAETAAATPAASSKEAPSVETPLMTGPFVRSALAQSSSRSPPASGSVRTRDAGVPSPGADGVPSRTRRAPERPETVQPEPGRPVGLHGPDAALQRREGNRRGLHRHALPGRSRSSAASAMRATKRSSSACSGERLLTQPRRLAHGPVDGLPEPLQPVRAALGRSGLGAQPRNACIGEKRVERHRPAVSGPRVRSRFRPPRSSARHGPPPSGTGLSRPPRRQVLAST